VATVDLLLGELGPYTPPPGGAVPLRFGEGISLLPALAGQPTRMPWVRISLTAADGPRAPWQPTSLSAADGPRMPWQHTTVQVLDGPRVPWSGITGAAAGAARLPWGAAEGRAVYPVVPWRRPHQWDVAVRAPWQRATGLHTQVVVPWRRAQTGQHSARTPWGRATEIRRAVRALWGAARLLIAPNTYTPPPVLYGITPPERGRVHLHFCVSDWSTDLVLGREACVRRGRLFLGAIESRRTYMQVHSLSAVRLPDLTPVPLTGFSLQADRDNFGWTLTAEGPTDILTLLLPSGGIPARLRVTLDGLAWEFIVEGLRRNRSHGRTSASATGRSASALLGDPYSAPRAYLNAVPMTAQQLVEDVLQYTDVSLDWRIDDWLVPAGAWSTTSSPLVAARQIAEAAGGVLQSPRTGESLIVTARYPILPWDWATEAPDVTLALDPITVEGYERTDRPAYDGVFVSGQAQGVLAQVKRTGSGPSTYMPLVTDPLITHLDAARQRGASLLATAGPQARMTLTLPVLTGSGEPGVIDPGTLLLCNDPAGAWRGLVTAVSVQASLETVRQTITVERHL
jgi:hypothetical protein